ncbi:hypothetical protein LSCM1_01397 [Leishmania martiniquensis]|uniref:Uncharacterized protein n=1 Tax=Leishmania martiniquensis TaxID=1580590 RepID=A0A836GX04_9TRYP|nr:hypothetical protein LSCM1_01397 [Leishmania martiniquensis]
MDTRGLRHLKGYLGKEGEKLARAKRAVDVVPVLASRQAMAAGTRGKPADATSASAKAPEPLSPSVMAYLESRLSSGATHKLSRTQMTLVAALAVPGSPSASSRAVGVNGGEATVTVTRAKIADMTAVVNALAVAALELAARCASEDTGTSKGTVEGSALFVLVDTSGEAAEVAAQLEGRYGLTVLVLSDESACRHPTFPSASGVAAVAGASRKRRTASETSAAKRLRTQSTSRSVGEATPREETVGGALALKNAVTVVVATPAGFLAVDRRSAIWKFMGSCAFLLRHPRTHCGSLLHTLQGGETAPSSSLKVTPQTLNAQRWDCLGHVSAIALLAGEREWLTAPELDLLTTLRVERGPSSDVDDASKSRTTSLSSAVAALRAPVTVHYAVAQGTHRFQFLFGLLKGLTPHRGIVVHVATRECVTFLYDTLYAFLGELPPYVALLSDYEGASAYTRMHSSADRQRLCLTFDSTVESGKDGKTAAVLLSCHGLVPKHGSVFLQYDIVPDVLNYSQFIAEVLTPSAVSGDGGNGKQCAFSSAGGEVVVRRETTVRQRKRSTSPTPAPVAARRVSAGASNATDAGEVSSRSNAASPVGVNYTHILLLLRPNEVAGVLRRLRHDGAKRYRLEFRELGTQVSGRYLLVGEKLKSMNKKLFALQNAAYSAYKATMRVYSTIGPRDVYDETKVNLEKVAEEFGYTELPLLDLRLKDTVFRPKEDYYRAARQKQQAERRVYKAFAQENILGEAPEEHIADKPV